MTSANPYALAGAKDIFDALRRGYHLSIEDGPLYHNLKANIEQYEQLFAALGLELCEHSEGFYYLLGTGTLSKTAQQMGLFMLILIDSLADQPVEIEKQLLEEAFEPERLPHLRRDRYGQYMRAVGVDTHEDLLRVIKALERLGFATRAADESFQFKTPVYRFLDLCLEHSGATTDGGLA